MANGFDGRCFRIESDHIGAIFVLCKAGASVTAYIDITCLSNNHLTIGNVIVDVLALRDDVVAGDLINVDGLVVAFVFVVFIVFLSSLSMKISKLQLWLKMKNE